jgi:multiple sugar transport system permease protein
MTGASGLPFAIFRHVVLTAGAIAVLAPFVWLLSLSIKPADEIFTTDIRLLPIKWDAERNFTEAFAKVPLHRYLLNGVIVTASIFLLQVLVALPAAYALAKLRFGFARPFFALVLLGLLIPSHVPAIPHYIMLSYAGLLNSYPALVMPSVISVFGIFWIRQFFRTVPDDLINAARLDGLSEFSIVWRIMLPAAVPALTAFGILSVVFHWNDYFWPLLVITSTDMAMPALGTVYLRNTEAGTDYGPLMAGTAIITAPLVIAFLLAQRRFIEGMTLTGLKG